MEQQKRNLIASAAFVFFSLFMILYAIPGEIAISASLGGGSASVDSRFFPYLTSAFIGVIAAVEFVFSFRKYCREKKAEQNPSEEKGREKQALLVFLIFVLYAVAFNWIGFIGSSIIFPPIVLFVMGSRRWQDFASYYAVAIITYLLFVYALKVPLP